MIQEGSIVLIYFNEKPQFFARIEQITPDVKQDWYVVTMKPFFMISSTEKPADNIDWTLRDIYINGEQFTMNGTPTRLEEVPPVCPPNFETQQEPQKEEVKQENTSETTKYLNSLKKQSVVDVEEYRKAKEQVFKTQESPNDPTIA